MKRKKESVRKRNRERAKRAAHFRREPREASATVHMTADTKSYGNTNE